MMVVRKYIYMYSGLIERRDIDDGIASGVKKKDDDDELITVWGYTHGIGSGA